MNKTELINAMAAKGGLTKTDAKKALDAFVEVTRGGLKKGDKIAILGFGTFSVAQRKARTGINPATKKPMKIKAKKVAKFKPGKGLAL